VDLTRILERQCKVLVQLHMREITQLYWNAQALDLGNRWGKAYTMRVESIYQELERIILVRLLLDLLINLDHRRETPSFSPPRTKHLVLVPTCSNPLWEISQVGKQWITGIRMLETKESIFLDLVNTNLMLIRLKEATQNIGKLSSLIYQKDWYSTS
jgi:hypothetical protein